jgi:hypothetical protein
LIPSTPFDLAEQRVVVMNVLAAIAEADRREITIEDRETILDHAPQQSLIARRRDLSSAVRTHCSAKASQSALNTRTLRLGRLVDALLRVVSQIQKDRRAH